MIRLRYVLVALAALALLTGCQGTSGALAGGAGTPLPTPSVTPTAACAPGPWVEADDCVPIDDEANMAANERYRDRMDPGEAGAIAEALVEPVLAELAPLASGAEPLSEDAVRRALLDGHVPDISIRLDGSPAAGYAFGADVGGACLSGGVVAGREPTAEPGGYILDGGCLALSGH